MVFFVSLCLRGQEFFAEDGYFLRAESFYNVASYMDEIGYLGSYGGKSLHKQSHGESFLSLLNHKFRGNGILLLKQA